MARLSGTIQITVNGERQFAAGAFSYSLGKPKNTMLVGPDGPHGHKEEAQVPFIEGEIRDRPDLDLSALQTTGNATVTLKLANGKVIALTGAVWASDGTVTTDEAKIKARWEGTSAEEMTL